MLEHQTSGRLDKCIFFQIYDWVRIEGKKGGGEKNRPGTRSLKE